MGAAALTGLFTLTDLVFKKGYELSPKELTVTLTKAQGPPRVRTMFVDAGDLENITRIRIQRD